MAAIQITPCDRLRLVISFSIESGNADSVRLLFTSFFGAVNIRVRLFEGATLHSLVMLYIFSTKS